MPIKCHKTEDHDNILLLCAINQLTTGGKCKKWKIIEVTTTIIEQMLIKPQKLDRTNVNRITMASVNLYVMSLKAV